MNIVKVYASAWIMVTAGAVMAYLAGYLHSKTILLFGAAYVGLILMGIVGVIPSTVVSGSNKPIESRNDLPYRA